MALFKQLKFLENEIDIFLDDIDQAGRHFKEGIREYLDKDMKNLHLRIARVSKLESDADKKRREIRFRLYSEMLIPESRGDVLGLLENNDNVLDRIKHVMVSLSVEKPLIPDFLRSDFLNLAQACSECVEALIKADMAYFKANSLINNYINKVDFYEKEADKYEQTIYKKLFDSAEVPDLGQKLHIKLFTENIAEISDLAQEMSERLSVSAIKRAM